MHRHLRAWRLYRNLTLEQVGNILGKKQTTVGRWERGLMKISTADLEALAKIYGASMTQLMGLPRAADMVATLDRAQAIIERMDAEALEHWLSVGEKMTVSKVS